MRGRRCTRRICSSPDRVWRAMTEVCRGMVLGTHQRISSLGTDRYLAWPTLILSFAAELH